MNSSTTMRLITGVHETVREKRYPRLVTESWVQRLTRQQGTRLGQTRRGRPPPDAAARVLSSLALIAALIAALATQCALG